MDRRPERHRRHLEKVYAELSRRGQELEEMRHEVQRANVLLALANQSLGALQQLHRAAADMALHERQEVLRLQGVVAELRAKVRLLTEPCACRPREEECGEGDDGYHAGPVS